MLKIRLQRVGRRNDPSYRVVVVDSRQGPKSGKQIDQVGFYNPVAKQKSIDKEKAKHWISVGAQASGTVHNLLVTEGVIDGKKINVLPKKRPSLKEESAPAPVQAAPEAQSAPEEASQNQNLDTMPEEVSEEPAASEEQV